NLPLICRLYSRAFRSGSSKYRQFACSLPALAAFWLLRLLGFRPRGQFIYGAPHGDVKAEFNALNTQFGAVYLPIHKGGYEAEVGAFLDAVVGPQATFLDIGSNWG